MKKIISTIALFFILQFVQGQSLGIFDGIQNSSNYYEKVLNLPVFSNGVSNLAVDIFLGNVSFWGNIEIEITGSYNYQNAAGKLSKTFAVGVNPNAAIFTNESRVTETLGNVSANIAIGDLEWDGTNSTYKIPIYHIVNTGNPFTIKIKLLSHGEAALYVKNSLSLSAQYNRTSIPKNYIHFNENIGIGTVNPTEKLSVNGNIKAKKLIISQTGWPDYVFDPKYKLKPLFEVEQFIKKYGHLPDVPSEVNVAKNGISVGDNQAILLKKIEELTLYVIELEKKVKKLENTSNQNRKKQQ